jgi:hypothetical protein
MIKGVIVEWQLGAREALHDVARETDESGSRN